MVRVEIHTLERVAAVERDREICPPNVGAATVKAYVHVIRVSLAKVGSAANGLTYAETDRVEMADVQVVVVRKHHPQTAKCSVAGR
jgi:hypothetical protein